MVTVTVEPVKSAQPDTVSGVVEPNVSVIVTVLLITVRLPVTVTGEPLITSSGRVAEPLITHTPLLHTDPAGA